MPRNTPTLTLAEAEAILAGAKAKVLEMGVNMSISVVDPRGDLITMMRTDGASWRTPPISGPRPWRLPASGAPAAS